MKFDSVARFIGAFGVCASIVASVFYVTQSTAQDTKQSQPQSTGEASPIYNVTIPDGYRDWHLIAVAKLEGGKLMQLRAQLGNDIAIAAFREGKLPFPDGSMIAALHWDEVSSDDNNKVLAKGFPGAELQSSVPGAALNAQFMVKDSKKYAASGGWGFADFKNGKPGDEALHKTCFACHEPAKDRDYVFTHYVPTPGVR
jgi:hypothetical protein